jgi:hypothetical protein
VKRFTQTDPMPYGPGTADPDRPINRPVAAVVVCFVLSVLVGCSTDLASASSFRLRADVTNQVEGYRLDATSLLFTSSGGERVVRSCEGELRGLWLVSDQGRSVLVVACGSPLQVALGFVVDGVQLDEGDACVFLEGRLLAMSERPWRNPLAFQAKFKPFTQTGSCS